MNNKINLYKSNYEKIVIVTLLFLPAIQLGYSYYFSVQIFFFGLLFLIALWNIEVNNKCLNYVFIGMFFFLIKILNILTSANDDREILLVLREFICFSAIILISHRISLINYNWDFIYKILFIVNISILLMVLFQLYFFSQGQYFGVPSDWFIMNKETLDYAELALYHGTRYRPPSFFGEPSYTAFISLFILVLVILSDFISIRRKVLISLVSLIIMFISGTMSGILSVIIFFLYYFVKIAPKNKKILVLILTAIGIFAFILAVLTSTEFSSRFLNLQSNSDSSSSKRLIDPIVYFLNNNEFEQIYGVNKFGKLLIDNAALGLLIHYGILSIFIILTLFWYIRNDILIIFVLLVFNFNGAFFAFDKVIVLSLMIGLSKSVFFSKYNFKLLQGKLS